MNPIIKKIKERTGLLFVEEFMGSNWALNCYCFDGKGKSVTISLTDKSINLPKEDKIIVWIAEGENDSYRDYDSIEVVIERLISMNLNSGI